MWRLFFKIRLRFWYKRTSNKPLKTSSGERSKNPSWWKKSVRTLATSWKPNSCKGFYIRLHTDNILSSTKYTNLVSDNVNKKGNYTYIPFVDSVGNDISYNKKVIVEILFF